MVTYPLNGIDYTAEDAELYFSARTSGVFSTEDFSITSIQGLNITLGSGAGWIRNTRFSGKVFGEENDTNLTFDFVNAVYGRIDVISARFDKSANKTEIVVVKGEAGANPQIPERIETEEIYDVFLYAVTRTASESAISEENIVDLRTNRQYCGIIQDTASEIVEEMNKRQYLSFWVGTQAEYAEIDIKDGTTLYIITDDTSTEDSLIDMQSRVRAIEIVNDKFNSRLIHLENGKNPIGASKNVTETINGTPITDIIHTDGKTVKDSLRAGVVYKPISFGQSQIYGMVGGAFVINVKVSATNEYTYDYFTSVILSIPDIQQDGNYRAKSDIAGSNFNITCLFSVKNSIVKIENLNLLPTNYPAEIISIKRIATY